MKSSGEYVQSFQGIRVFCPNPLPPDESCLSPATLMKLEAAAHALGQVDMCERLLPNSDILTYSSLQLESIASSTIENTITSPDELIRYQVSNEPYKVATKEVANYGEALAWGFAELKSKPITINMMLRLHSTLMSGVRGDIAVGRFKNTQNYIGGVLQILSLRLRHQKA